MFSIPLVIFLLFLVKIIKFAIADADFTLLSKNLKRSEIEDKVVWITGASRGIGEVLAEQFANLGAKLILSARSEAELERVKNELTGEVLAKQFASLGAKLILSARNEAELERVKSELTGKYAPNEVKILPLDLASGEHSLRDAVERAEAFFPGFGVDYMIHNAAFERPKSAALDVSEESFKATINVNVLGTISLTKLLAPYMLKRGRGHFVVMSSAAGKTPAPGQAVYCASKFALNGYFHSLRSELFQKGIKVTVVCPGPIETSKSAEAGTSAQPRSSERRVSVERCAELTIIAASHGLKEVWISHHPVLAVMYLVQYMPTIGFWLMDKIGGKRVEVAAQKGNTYSLGMLFGKSKKN